MKKLNLITYCLVMVAFLCTPAVAVNVEYTLKDLGIVQYPVIQNWGGAPVVQLLVEPALRDLDGDGDSDVVIGFGVFTFVKANERFYHPIILENLGNGNLRNVPIHGVRVAQSGARDIEFADFNLDGRLDIVIIGSGYDGPDGIEVGFGDQNILLYSNPDGSYTDVSHVLPQEMAFTHSVTVGDVNGDGWPDIYIGNLSHTVHLLLNTGPGFREGALPPIFNFFREWPNPVTKYTSSLLVDIDNDGILEMVLGATGQDGPAGISVIVDQDGQGNFGAFRNLPMGLFGPGTITVDVDAADINGDGLKDLMLSQTPSTPFFYQGRGLQILIQRLDGSFADETANRMFGLDPVARWIQFASFADADKDGDPDILIKHDSGLMTWQHEPVVIYNNGGGVFEQSSDQGYPSYIPYGHANGYHGGYDKVLGTFFAFVVDFTHYINTGVVGGSDVLRIAELDMVHPY